MSNVRFRFKLVLIGEGAVGKTSIRQKYMGKGFTGEYLKTIGADFASKTVELKDANGENIKSIFQIWDLAGQLEFKEVRASFYGGCQGILLVFDLTRKETMDKLKDWILEAAKNAGGSIKGFYLIGNKSDLPDRQVTKDDALEFATFLTERLKFPIPYIETSASTGENIQHLFLNMCRTLLMKEDLDIPEISEKEAEAEAAEPAEATEPAEETEPITEPEVPEAPAPPISSEADAELAARVSQLEKRVNQLDDFLKQIAKLLKKVL